MLTDELRSLPLLEGFTDGQIADLAASGEEVPLEAGAHLFDEGRPAVDWWLLLEGRIDVVRRIGHTETVMATMQVPGQWAGGFRAWDEHGVYMGSARVTEPSRVFRLPAERLSVHAEAWFPFAVHLLRGLIGGHRPRHDRRGRRPRLRTVLHDQGGGQRHRPGTRPLPPDRRRTARWRDRRAVATR